MQNSTIESFFAVRDFSSHSFMMEMSDKTYDFFSLRFYLTKIWIFWFMISLGSSQRSSKRASVLELCTASFFEIFLHHLSLRPVR